MKPVNEVSIIYGTSLTHLALRNVDLERCGMLLASPGTVRFPKRQKALV